MKRNTRIIVLKLKIKMYIVLVLHSLIKVYLSFEAVLGNKEFELVVFGVTFAVIRRRSASGHDVSVLSVGDR
jgi:hypothetical protein